MRRKRSYREDVRQRVLGLHRAGWSVRAIAKGTGIPRATVGTWIAGYKKTLKARNIRTPEKVSSSPTKGLDSESQDFRLVEFPFDFFEILDTTDEVIRELDMAGMPTEVDLGGFEDLEVDTAGMFQTLGDEMAPKSQGKPEPVQPVPDADRGRGVSKPDQGKPDAVHAKPDATEGKPEDGAESSALASMKRDLSERYSADGSALATDEEWERVEREERQQEAGQKRFNQLLGGGLKRESWEDV